ncbi:MAG: nucleotidyl transferase AbiEii/AbiGii toxin family protein [Verrucomicrobiae bacterium]|nr:nucleotidyl transferase AbiEii/AbiGii toxin family protein [Verrucomicrobiae bacterium]
MSDNLLIHRHWMANQVDFREAVVHPFPVAVMDERELWAEKIRAAVSRRKPAIRDFFDLDYAVQRTGLNLKSSVLAGLVEKKLAVKGNGPVDMSMERLANLRGQVEKELRNVLRNEDFQRFDLDRIWADLHHLSLKSR